MSYRVNTTDIRSFWVNEPKFFATVSINSLSTVTDLETALANASLNITLNDYLPLSEGIYIRNNTTSPGATNHFNVYLSPGDAALGLDTMIRVASNQQVFISTTDPSQITITTRNSATISYSIIAY